MLDRVLEGRLWSLFVRYKLRCQELHREIKLIRRRFLWLSREAPESAARCDFIFEEVPHVHQVVELRSDAKYALRGVGVGLLEGLSGDQADVDPVQLQLRHLHTS